MAITKQEIETFVWEGKDKRGKKMSGERVGRSEMIIKAELRQMGIIPSRVRKKPKPLFGSAGSRISAKDLAVFTRQLATMLNSGIPLVQSFTIISQATENPRMKKLITDIRTEVESGSALSETLKKHPVYFDDLYVNLVESGESAGVLDQVLASIADYKERIESIKGKVKKAMFYPAPSSRIYSRASAPTCRCSPAWWWICRSSCSRAAGCCWSRPWSASSP